MSKAQTLEILERLRHAFHPPPDIPDDTWRIYRDTLCDFEPSVLQAASLHVAKTSKFWPSIAELRNACLEVSGALAKIPGAGEAYIEARRAALSIGSYVRPISEDFSHPIVMRAAIQSAGGWRRWCLSENETPLRAKFFDVYRELRERELRQQALPPTARQLTAEESRQLLEEVELRGARAGLLLSSGAEDAARSERPIHELMSSFPLSLPPDDERGVVGAGMTQDEWEKRKNDLLRQAAEP